GGVCGFTLLHFAAFAGKSKACQTLIDLGVNINAKTQPLCVTPSQQFCRPTPLDLTIFVANKRAREQVQRVLQAADASYGGVKMESLDKLWLGLIKHQLLLIKDEVVKYNSKIPSALRRVLRTEPRWREIVNFPGEDAATMERKRLRKAFTVWRRKLLWVLVGDASMVWKHRLAVVAWNFFLFLISWWLFGFQTFELLQAILVSMVLMASSSLPRQMEAAELWQRLPSQADLQSRLPSEQLMEQQLAKAWQKLHTASIMVEELLLAAPDEIQKLRAMGVQSYAQDAKARFDVWQAIEEPEEAVEELEEEEPNAKDEQRRKKSAAIASKIKGIKAGEAVANSDALRRNKGRRRHVK
ncbi:Hypothetical protein SCF082_LOCUS9703, partial [Durusdinium trenchii]